MTELNTNEIIDKALEVAQRELVGRPIYAEIILKQLLKASPGNSQALQLLSIVKLKTGEFDEAIRIGEQIIELDPENPDNYNNLALSHANLDQFEKSIFYMNKAMELRPNNFLFANNLALQYRQIHRYDLAIDLFNKALEIKNAPEIWSNMGGVYGELKNMEKAEECFRTAITLDPNFTAAHVDLSFVHHLKGDWKEGFKEYEWRFDYFKQLNFYKAAYNQGKRWNREPLEGKRILLYGEQGLGDQIQFLRYCKLLKDQGAYVIVHCSELLRRLFDRCSFIDDTLVRDIFSGKGEEFPIHDYQCSLMSLPYLLDTEIVDGKIFEPLATLNFKDYKETFNIGICWAGSAAHPHDAVRSTFLKYFQEIHDTPHVKLFNLQMCPTKRMFANGKQIIDFAEECDHLKIVDMTPMIQDFEDSATVISGLDLVITVDTALVHLAGSLGIPCWMMVPYNCDWRWKLTGDTTVWYDSIRIFRQPNPNDWQPVFEELKKELDAQIVLQNKRSQLLETEVARS